MNDASGILCCATPSEAAVARRLGLPHAVIGLGGAQGLPEGRLVSFGLAGALHDGLAVGEVVDAIRVVDAEGTVLWEGPPLGASGARTGTILALDAVVDDPAQRRRLHERTGADAADMESGVLARTGRLAGCLRSISDTPHRGLGPLATVVGMDGKVRWPALAHAVGASPLDTGRAVAASLRALRSLRKAAA